MYAPDELHGWVTATLLRVDQGAQTADVEIAADEVLGVPGGEVRQVDLTRPELTALDEGHGGSDKAAAAGLPLQNLQLPPQGAEDMCTLSFLHEPAILHNLRTRFLANSCPYTYTGGMVLSMNPYAWNHDLYSDRLKEAYMLASAASELPPHIYFISAEAYKGLSKGGQDGLGQNQSILVSGESGAGKTESVKQLITHLASVAAAPKPLGGHDERPSGEDGRSTIADKVLESNPLLESFGNSQTVRNDNSSRFGKFSQLQFQKQALSSASSSSTSKPVLVGSKCITYLLEKSRVVHHAQGERYVTVRSAAFPFKGRGRRK